jgi:reduction in cnn dots 2
MLDCEVKQSLTSECCPVCTGECLSATTGKVYKSNETWSEDNDCVHCTCVNGKKLCNAELCERPKCKNPVKVAGICCLACPNEQHEQHDESGGVLLLFLYNYIAISTSYFS